MSADVVLRLNKCTDLQKRLQFQLIFHCAPFLKGAKGPSLIILDRSIEKPLLKLLKETDISCHTIHLNHKRCGFYLYRKDVLVKILSDESVQIFLNRFGYGLYGDISIGQLPAIL